jgi:3-hydroxyisobutyrate dehydrogenase-like beta-hydroxyacid dehydrogenase
MHVGFIGLGLMGKPMSLNVLKAGFPVVVYNRTSARVHDVVSAGAETGASVSDVAGRADVVLTCLGAIGASEEVFLGPGGLLAHSRPGQIFIDHSTVAPGTARTIARAAADRQVAFLDAPISGGPEGAAAATLTIMVGGDAEDFSRAEPVLRAMGRHVQRVGPVGTGCVVKLVNQALTAIHAAAAAEAMTLGTLAGADPAVLLQILGTSFGQSRMLERSAARFMARDFSAATQVKRLSLDVDLVRDLSAALGFSLPLLSAASELCNQTSTMGLGDADIAALVLPLERRAGVTVVAQPAPSHSTAHS